MVTSTDCIAGWPHVWTPWVRERWQPSFDSSVCRGCGLVRIRKHVEGTETSPDWLVKLILEKDGHSREVYRGDMMW